jgi:hypothetical protein
MRLFDFNLLGKEIQTVWILKKSEVPDTVMELLERKASAALRRKVNGQMSSVNFFTG